MNDTQQSALHRRALGAVIPAIRQKVSGGIIAGLFFVATGFGPDEWFKRLFVSLHLSENLSAAFKLFDPRIVLVGIGVILIGIDILLRHLRHEQGAHASPAASQTASTGPLIPAPLAPSPNIATNISKESSLTDKPSIAVLPFQNLSGNAGQEYFADGVVEDIIIALSRFSSLFVIARNSSFTFKGRSVSIKQVGAELGVRYVLEGSVRRSEDNIRITAQLIDATTDAHVWADKFDGDLQEVFTLQDKVTSAVVAAIAPAIEKAEYEKRRARPTEHMGSYDWYLRGMASLHQFTPEALRESLRCFDAAIALDENFAAAWGMAAWAHVMLRSYYIANTPDDAADRVETNRLARKAITLGSNDALALATAAHALAYVVNDYDGAKAPAARALSLNPNLATAWLCSAWIDVLCNDGEAGLGKFEHAMRLSPLDPFKGGMLAGASWSCFMAGHYQEGLNYAQESLKYRKTAQNMGAAAANAFRLGDINSAQLMIKLWRDLDPSLSLKDIPSIYPVRGTFPSEISILLRECGMPE